MAARHRRCPTPDKVKYATYAAAAAVLRSAKFTRLRVPIRAYRCRGHYHLTGNV